jgi:hypothetical protein
MTLFRRRPGEVMYMVVHLQVMRRRMWLLLPLARRSSKRVQREETSPKGERKKDMNKVRCFACHKFGHYAGQCPNKKKKQTAASVAVKEFSTKFDKEFSLIVCLSTRTIHSDTWYIDSGASRHMRGVHEHR